MDESIPFLFSRLTLCCFVMLLLPLLSSRLYLLDSLMMLDLSEEARTLHFFGLCDKWGNKLKYKSMPIQLADLTYIWQSEISNAGVCLCVCVYNNVEIMSIDCIDCNLHIVYAC